MTKPTSSDKTEFLKLAKISAQIASDKKSLDIKILNTRPITTLTDYFLILSVESAPQMNAVIDAIHKTLKEKENRLPLHLEGRNSSWSVLDYGGLVIHVMLSQARAFYALDKIWMDARKVPFKYNKHGKS
ncbi:MAG: ribosome silencing factor [Elusimicrobia bacterium]|nr:ribosome silencing factor [Candidatus Liberimonas magnetica]